MTEDERLRGELAIEKMDASKLRLNNISLQDINDMKAWLRVQGANYILEYIILLELELHFHNNDQRTT